MIERPERSNNFLWDQSLTNHMYTAYTYIIVNVIKINRPCSLKWCMSDDWNPMVHVNTDLLSENEGKWKIPLFFIILINDESLFHWSNILRLLKLTHSYQFWIWIMQNSKGNGSRIMCRHRKSNAKRVLTESFCLSSFGVKFKSVYLKMKETRFSHCLLYMIVI